MAGRRWRQTVGAAAAAVASAALVATATGATAGLSARTVIADQRAATKVIVVLHDQYPGDPATARLGSRRARLEAAAQGPLLAQVERSGGRLTHRYETLNAFAATVTRAEAASLAANPAVAAIMPDVTIRLRAPARGGAGAAQPAQSPLDAGAVCPSNPQHPLLEPEALQITHTAFADPAAPQAQDLATGRGVTVAFLADGLSVNNPDLIRPDGSHVVVDYRDFSGEGVNAPSFGVEAFGDASSIAAQGTQVYDLSTFVNAAHPLPTGCTITVRGVAPGASLVALKVNGSSGYITASAVVQALDWAVSVDHVNVISESLGANQIPDTMADFFRRFNAQAVDAGVTVVEGTGDAGAGNTIFSSATDPSVLSVGATYSFRAWAQVTGEGAQLATNGYVDNNPATLSSSGFTQQGRTLDLLAPGDAGWALCSPDPLYTGCIGFNGNPSSIQFFGGTSQSGPFVAGAAALVIQAYRDSHHGASPTPSLVRRLITGTADDLQLPGAVQGAGLLDTLAAVRAAQSVSTSDGVGTPVGDGLLASVDQVGVSASAGSTQHFSVSVTNTGTTSQLLSAHMRMLGSPTSESSGTITLDPTTAPTFVDEFGTTDPYTTTTFSVQPGQDDLRVELAWPGPTAFVFLTLIDPQGRLQSISDPQGFAGFARDDVREPAAGTWTAIVWTLSGQHGFSGPVHYDIATARLVSVDAVSPQQVSVARGATATFNVTSQMPIQPGDAGRDLEIDSSSRRDTVVPVVLRSLVALSPGGASFSGVFSGGNGRPFALADQQTYSFNVPAGAPGLGVSMTLGGDLGTQVEGFLIDPEGNMVSQVDTVRSDSAGNTTFTNALQAYRVNPMAGQWTFVAWVLGPIAGNATTVPFTADITLATQPTQARGIPKGSTIRVGQTAHGAITITNTSAAPESIFLDPRLARYAPELLVPQTAATLSLPLSATAIQTQWVVPTETRTLIGAAQASAPVGFDMSPGYATLTSGQSGDPDVLATSFGDRAAAQVSSDEIAPGPWLMSPNLIGPFVTGVTATVTDGMVAQTRVFDPSVSSASGDVWASYVQPAAPAATPVTINPGETATIAAGFTAVGHHGETISGTLFVDDWSYYTLTGDEIAAIPYSFHIR